MGDIRNLEERVKDVTDRIVLSRNATSAEAYRTISGAVGTETPIGVLTEIREGQTRLIEVIKDLRVLQEDAEARAQKRHEEMCAILLAMAEGGKRDPRQPGGRPSVAMPDDTHPPDNKAYYGSCCISNGTYLIACVLMQMDKMLRAHPRFRAVESTDSTYMEIKDWFNICGMLFNADKQTKGSLRIPKKSDDDFREAVGIVASPVSGRKPDCDVTHLSLLLSRCPAVMNTVEWTRKSLLRCTGALSPERACRFNLFRHPFINSESELAIDHTPVLRKPNKCFHQDFTAMKATARKEYIRMVLAESIRPMDAMARLK